MNQAVAVAAQPAGPRRSAGRRLWRIWDQASIYLPVLLMGVLALGSYWLVRITPTPAVESVHPEVGSEPDHFMRRFSVKVFNSDGSLRTEIQGEEARHYPDSGRMEIDTARIRSYSEAGQLTVASARQVASNAAKTEFVLEGDAVVVREGLRDATGRLITQPMEFQGDFLRVNTADDTVFSDRPVTIIRGADRLAADRLSYQGDSRTAKLSGKVRVQLQPRRP
ncbi:MAG: LPS export ABC transporter periplasmic protein LptC [Burkholderiales bacterium]|nr:MAG: LPS export ABC transporter periplasmic protein LptC [Burkholderiales bacterium]